MEGKGQAVFILKCCRASQTYCTWSVYGPFGQSSSDKCKPCSLKRCGRLPQLLPGPCAVLSRDHSTREAVTCLKTLEKVPFWSTWIALLAAHLPARPMGCARSCVKKSPQQNSCLILWDFLLLPVLWCSCAPCVFCAAPVASSPACSPVANA